MTIYFAGCEDICFKPLGIQTIYSGTIAGYYDSNYVRSGMLPRVSDGHFGKTFTTTPITEVWLHFEMALTYDFFNADANITFYDSATGNPQLQFQSNSAPATEYYHRIRIWDAGNVLSVLSGTFTGNIPAADSRSCIAQRVQFDIHLKIHATNGIARIFINQALQGQFLGDTTTFNGQFDRMEVVGVNAAGTMMYSQFILANEDTRLMKCATIYPDAEGDTAYDSGTYVDIDEATLNAADFTQLTVTNNFGLSTMSDLLPGDSAKIVKAIHLHTRYERLTGGSPPDLKLTLKTGGTLAVSSTTALPSIGVPENFAFIWNQNPVTVATWTYAQTNAIQLGVKAVP